jgi:hypothetical protein
MLRSSQHAILRQAQRNLSSSDITFILENGRRIRSGGVLHVFLGRKDIPYNESRNLERLEGTVLVMDDSYTDPVLITVYRNRRALKSIRSKQKYLRASKSIYRLAKNRDLSESASSKRSM